MVVDHLLSHAEFGRNDLREDAPHFINLRPAQTNLLKWVGAFGKSIFESFLGSKIEKWGISGIYFRTGNQENGRIAPSENFNSWGPKILVLKETHSWTQITKKVGPEIFTLSCIFILNLTPFNFCWYFVIAPIERDLRKIWPIVYFVALQLCIIICVYNKTGTFWQF